MIKILGVDDNIALAGIFDLALGLESDMQCLGWLNRADDLVAEVERLSPDVVLIDLTMPGKDPLVALAEVIARKPDTSVIAFSAWSEDEVIENVFKAGAKGYVSKGRDLDDVMRVIREVASGASHIKLR